MKTRQHHEYLTHQGRWPQDSPPASGDHSRSTQRGRPWSSGTVERRHRLRKDARKGIKALIIDDSPTVIAALRKVLRSAGYNTSEALSAEQGLALIEQDPPDLVFLDIVLPGMNGLTRCAGSARIRRASTFR